MERTKTKVTYGWAIQCIVIPKREGQQPKSPIGGRTTKVTYRWTVQSKALLKREGWWQKSPMGGQSEVKSYTRGRDDDQSKVITEREGQRLKSSTGERKNQATHECLGKNSKSSYRQVEGWTKPPTSALVKFLSLPIDGWRDELSHPLVPW